jgi:hypothetical protein
MGTEMGIAPDPVKNAHFARKFYRFTRSSMMAIG